MKNRLVNDIMQNLLSAICVPSVLLVVDLAVRIVLSYVLFSQQMKFFETLDSPSIYNKIASNIYQLLIS